MRPFARPFPIHRLSLEARVVYTGFCLFLLLGSLSAVWLYQDDDLGVSPAAARRYYLGEAAEGDTALRFEKPARQVMETFHFHLFSVPVCLLIIAHLYMMTSDRARLKAWLIGITTLSTFVHLLAPPLARFASPSWAVVVFPSAVTMAAGWCYLSARPVYEMWWRRPATPEDGGDESD